MTQNNKYANGKIYKITDNAYTKCYIGSTIQPLSSRIGGHRRDYKRYLDGKRNFITSFALFEEFGVENCKIELMEEYPCEKGQSPKLLYKEASSTDSSRKGRKRSYFFRPLKICCQNAAKLGRKVCSK